MSNHKPVSDHELVSKLAKTNKLVKPQILKHPIPYYGAHLSVKNGIISAIDEINQMGGNMIQIFISNPMSVKFTIDKKKFSESECDKIINKLKSTNSALVIHLPYVLNMAKPLPLDPLNSPAFSLICNQLLVSELIGSIGCVIHVGKHLDLTETEGQTNMYESFKHIINFMKEHDLKTKILLETSAGQGTELLSTKNNSIDDFANFYNRFEKADKRYIGICVDTCHIFAAGYDIRTEEQVKRFFDEFNKKIGLQYLDLIHLNDSKKGHGCCVDRHENLGEGEIGLVGLRHVIRYCMYYRIPTILETPDTYQSEIDLINEVKLGVDEWSQTKS